MVLKDGWGSGAFAILHPLFSILASGASMATTGLTGRFDHFMAKSSQVALHEPFTHKTGLFRSNLVKASQTKNKGFTGVFPYIDRVFPYKRRRPRQSEAVPGAVLELTWQGTCYIRWGEGRSFLRMD
jgi:hypothetical protein